MPGIIILYDKPVQRVYAIMVRVLKKKFKILTTYYLDDYKIFIREKCQFAWFLNDEFSVEKLSHAKI